MSHQHSRKTFFAKLLGLLAVSGVAPKLIAKPSVDASGSSAASAPATSAFKVVQDSRAVARSGESV